ncbi:MAG TPA: nucleoside 2-deoxyribosyltransferase [Acidimicrobiales bacterium]
MTTTEPGGAAGSPVYCAGPMFSLGDKREQRRISSVLKEAGFTTYLPHKEGIEVAQALRLLTNAPPDDPADFAAIVDFARKIGFALDIFQVVKRCNSVVFNMDGRVPDEGSAVEAAVAFAVCKPIVIFKSTVISLMAGYDSPMIQGLATNWRYATTLDSLPGAVRIAVKSRTVSADDGRCEHLGAVVDLGGRVWEIIDEIHQAMGDSIPALLLLVNDLKQSWRTQLNAAFGPDAPAPPAPPVPQVH